MNAKDIVIESPIAVTRTQQHINSKIVPTLSRALLSFSVQTVSETSTGGIAPVESDSIKLNLNTSIQCPSSLNIRGWVHITSILLLFFTSIY